jgi:acetyl-CoA carboxylase alpha subunit
MVKLAPIIVRIVALVTSSCASLQWEDATRASNAATMQKVVQAALDCGFREAELIESPFPEPNANTGLRVRFRSSKDQDKLAAWKCLDQWIAAHPELEVLSYMKYVTLTLAPARRAT